MCHCPLIPSYSSLWCSSGFSSMGLGQPGMPMHLVNLLPFAGTRHLAWVFSAPMPSVSVTPRPLWTHCAAPMAVGRTEAQRAGWDEAIPSFGLGLTNSLPSSHRTPAPAWSLPPPSLSSEGSNSALSVGRLRVCVCTHMHVHVFIYSFLEVLCLPNTIETFGILSRS